MTPGNFYRVTAMRGKPITYLGEYVGWVVEDGVRREGFQLEDKGKPVWEVKILECKQVRRKQ